jgi:hypothetical protein
MAQAAMWEVCVIATPEGTKFLDIPLLEELTGYPVRSQYKHPAEPDVLPRADAIVVFPATFNTINKWASGISDTLAVGLLCEYMGLGMPIVAVPCFRTGGGLDGHPIFFKNLELLKACGVRIIYEPETYPPKNRVAGNVILHELDDLMKMGTTDRSGKSKRKHGRYYLRTHQTTSKNHGWVDEVRLLIGDSDAPVGEAKIRWYVEAEEGSPVPRLEVEVQDSNTMFLLPDVLALLARLGKHVQADELCELLGQHFDFIEATILPEPYDRGSAPG